MLQIYIVRHGQTAWNLEQRFQGHSNTPLDEFGLKQAELIGQRLQSIKADHIYSSDLIRAYQTAEQIGKLNGTPITTNPLLRESSFGTWEGKTRKEIETDTPGAFDLFRSNPAVNRPPDGEALNEVRTRILQAFKEILSSHKDGKIVIVGHGGALRWLIVETLSAPQETYFHLRLDNASLSLLEFENGRSWLSLFNDISHLGELTSDGVTSMQLNK